MLHAKHDAPERGALYNTFARVRLGQGRRSSRRQKIQKSVRPRSQLCLGCEAPASASTRVCNCVFPRGRTPESPLRPVVGVPHCGRAVSHLSLYMNFIKADAATLHGKARRPRPGVSHRLCRTPVPRHGKARRRRPGVGMHAVSDDRALGVGPQRAQPPRQEKKETPKRQVPTCRADGNAPLCSPAH